MRSPRWGTPARVHALEEGPAWAAMRFVGTPFARALGEAWAAGTPEERDRLTAAFADLVAHYGTLAPDVRIELRM
ncbi:MAG TPA: hypothetical protein VIG68_06560 [Lysobacter sp.]